MPRKAPIPIYDGDDFERMAELRREVDIAERKYDRAREDAEASASAARLGDDDTAVAEAKAKYEEAQQAFSAFVDEAAERAETWVLHPIGHEEFRALLRDHPPRKVTETVDGKEVETTHPDDLGFDVNTETYPKALMLFVDPEDEEIRTVHEPFESVAALRKRIKRLSAGEFDSMWIAAHMLNNGAVADPKVSNYYADGRR